MWLKDVLSKNFPVAGPMLQEKAADLAKGLGVDDFVGGSGWLERFNKRHDICFRVLCGESASATNDQTDQWTSTTVPRLLDE